MIKIQNSVNFRLVILGLMAIGFLIPLGLVGSLIGDRHRSSEEAVEEISSKWGGNQVIAGPFLVVPYNVRIPKSSNDNSKKIEWDYETHYTYFLPEEIRITGDLKSEIRKRSIYQAVLYNGEIQVDGKFKIPVEADFPSETSYIYWSDVRLVTSITDGKGLGKEIRFVWSGKEKNLQPGTESPYFPSGFHADLNLSERESSVKFQMHISLKGSESFSIVPVGKENTVQISSDWNDPSFEGNLLPKDRTITESGFNAVWESSYFGRNYPQIIRSMDANTAELILASANGVKLIIPADHYQKMERSVKYALLILVTSFTLFFLLEVFGGIILHPIQYLLIGSCMVVFYILNLSLSEHLGFVLSYSLASLAVSSLIGYYAASVLKNKKKGVLSGFFYICLYTFLYVVLSSEDQALLLGSIAVFVLLAIVMHFTRKIDWYSFGKERQD
ncbi:cell envelope integrity protein CreD [Leptospira ilyithenensis]|uniref:Cell envelope integrity protein CreD n=1 Tax=Leptospira ilyithenensis TaxID=2484901 RepID=A0A4R9LTS8_9LEPT|nr:cell envelope integrity protein CreD [Leptospira ilyithenensis]TGN13359.1 cell envelope integrity protein CreD [Leptospira ilyithenensis]